MRYEITSGIYQDSYTDARSAFCVRRSGNETILFSIQSDAFGARFYMLPHFGIALEDLDDGIPKMIEYLKTVQGFCKDARHDLIERSKAKESNYGC